MTSTPKITKARNTQSSPNLRVVHSSSISRDSDLSLVEQLVRTVSARIDEQFLRPGSRMPSIRQFAEQQGVSRFTVVEAYDRLVARGLLVSRRGSGFFVKDATPLTSHHLGKHEEVASKPPQVDVVWLVRNMFREQSAQRTPGSGLLPNAWLDADLVAQALRSVARQNQNILLQYGDPKGFLPLRQQLSLKLAELEIKADQEQFILTSGVTQGLDIVARHFLRPGDTVFVDDPAWFLMFGAFVTMGAKVIGIPRLQDGPDIERLAEMAAIHKPKLFVINSVLHNPTSHSLSAAKAFQVLKIAEQFDFRIVEDDIYCDMHPGSNVQAATRISALDQLNRVIYLSGFSKTLAANLRVGFIACERELAERLADRKMLTSLTTSEIGERVIYKVLSEGHYRKSTDRLRSRLDAVREKTIRQLDRMGIKSNSGGNAGMFIWADLGRDSSRLTEIGHDQGILFAPGSLFSPSQLPSNYTRLNVSTMSDPDVLRLLENYVNQA